MDAKHIERVKQSLETKRCFCHYTKLRMTKQRLSTKNVSPNGVMRRTFTRTLWAIIFMVCTVSVARPVQAQLKSLEDDQLNNITAQSGIDVEINDFSANVSFGGSQGGAFSAPAFSYLYEDGDSLSTVNASIDEILFSDHGAGDGLLTFDWGKLAFDIVPYNAGGQTALNLGIYGFRGGMDITMNHLKINDNDLGALELSNYALVQYVPPPHIGWDDGTHWDHSDPWGLGGEATGRDFPTAAYDPNKPTAYVKIAGRQNGSGMEGEIATGLSIDAMRYWANGKESGDMSLEISGIRTNMQIGDMENDKPLKIDIETDRNGRTYAVLETNWLATDMEIDHIRFPGRNMMGSDDIGPILLKGVELEYVRVEFPGRGGTGATFR